MIVESKNVETCVDAGRLPPASIQAVSNILKGRPRIALVAASLDIVGGQGVQARALIDSLRIDGNSIVFVPVNPAFPRVLRALRRVRYARTVFNQLMYFISLMRLRHADVIHIFSASYWSFLLAPVPAMLMARAFGKYVVLHYHSGEADDHLTRWGMRVHPWLRLAHIIVVPSVYLQQVFTRHGYATRVIRNVVDLSRFHYRARECLGPRLLSVRNFDAHYRVDMVLRAFALVKKSWPDATLTVAGYGPDGRALQQLAVALQVDGIQFVGRVEPDDMPMLYDHHDIFINASVIDNQPVSVLEAFAAGLPVISTRTGDIAAMVRDGATGTTVSADQPAQIAEAVLHLHEQPENALRMAIRARTEVGQYTWECVRDEWASVYAMAIP